MEEEILNRLTTLGHKQRMAVFRLLARRYPDEVAAGDIAAALDLKPNTLSVYLATLMQASLVTQTRHGTSLRYRVRWDSVHAMTDYLILDCCRGRPDLCTPARDASVPVPSAGDGRKRNVLFICTGNATRSIFAEAILRREAGDRFDAYSAGTRPQPALHPLAIRMLKARGHDVGGLRSKPLSEFQTPGAPTMDFVFTVCDRSANDDCPAWAGQPIAAHWGVPDPAGANGTEAERWLAFGRAYDRLQNRIRAFAALPLDRLDAVTLQARVDDISLSETIQ